MYHIKNDKRSITSAHMIYDGLKRLLDIKTWNEISITELAEFSGVGRTTFYRIFDTKEDVILYKIDEITSEMYRDVWNNLKPRGEIWEYDVYCKLFSALIEHKDFIHILIKANLERTYMDKIAEEALESLAFLKVPLSLSEKDWEYVLNMRIAMAFEAMRVMILKYPTDNAKDLTAALVKNTGNLHLRF